MGRATGQRSEDAATRAAAIAALHNNPNYLNAIATLAASSEVWATRAIVSEQGETLLAERAVLAPDFVQQWQGHKLAQSLDDVLAVREPVDITTLQQCAQTLLLQHPLGRAMGACMGLESSIFTEVLGHTVWPARAAFQLTVMRAQLPGLYEHSVLHMMVAVFLARQQGWNVLQCARLAAAALLHDVGMLYLSPAWKDPGYQLSLRERVQLAAHPVLGRAVVAAMEVYPRSVEDAVLEHHERMDGGGYPRHLQGEAISPMGRILLVAEVVSGLYEKYADMPAQRLSLMLRLNPGRYPAEHVAAVLHLLRFDLREAQSAQRLTLDGVLQQSQQLAQVRQYWASCKKVLPAQWRSDAVAPAVDYIDRSMQALQVSLAESGADMREQVDWPEVLAHDTESVQELGLIMREALWQVERCTHTCAQRWPQLAASLPRVDAPQGGAEPSVVVRALQTWLCSVRKVLGLDAPAVRPQKDAAPQPAQCAAAETTP